MKILFVTVFLLGFVACGPSAEEKQHHLYNIEQCKAEQACAKARFRQLSLTTPSHAGHQVRSALHLVRPC